MRTDWLIVRRLAAELDRALRGGRIDAAGSLSGDRFALVGPRGSVVVDAFGPTPILALEDAALAPRRDAGWARAFAEALAGLRVDAVRARRGDRLVAFECSARSRFGVRSGFRLVCELTPRFGNLVLLRDDTVVAAAREFARTAGTARATVVGEAYEPPPLPEFRDPMVPLGEALEALSLTGDAPALALAVRALRYAVPLVPQLVAESLVSEAAPFAKSGAALTERTLARARAVVEATAGEPAALGDVYAYRDGARLVQCHVVPLAQFTHLELERVPAMAPLVAETLGAQTRARTHGAFEARRAALRARITKRLDGLAREREALLRERDDASARDELRRRGDLLYAHLAEVRPGAAEFVPPSDPTTTIQLDPAMDAKANAAAIFRRYRKATAKLTHVERRSAELAAAERFVGELAWEAERGDSESLEEIADAFARLERRTPPAARERARKRKPIDVRLSPDAHAYVGRSPRGNAELTFTIARPDDLWFHARATPGAHVVLRLDAQRPPTGDELRGAAELAAYHSKAREAEKVDVDYTERKHVRKQQNAPPGLVWYTHARTLLVAPQEHGE